MKRSLLLLALWAATCAPNIIIKDDDPYPGAAYVEHKYPRHVSWVPTIVTLARIGLMQHGIVIPTRPYTLHVAGSCP